MPGAGKAYAPDSLTDFSADVVADVLQRRPELVCELSRARPALLENAEDLGSQGVG